MINKCVLFKELNSFSQHNAAFNSNRQKQTNAGLQKYIDKLNGSPKCKGLFMGHKIVFKGSLAHYYIE